MHIEIHIPRFNPWKALALGLIGAWFLMPHLRAQEEDHVHAEGGIQPTAVIAQAQNEINRERVKQAVLDRKEEILRYELEKLEEEAMRTSLPEAMHSLSEHRSVLLQIIGEKRHSEGLLKQSLEQMWEAQGLLFQTNAGDAGLVLEWPVEPALGISARFEDDGYQRRFGIPHHAIDIPVEQGSVILAAGEGVVSAAKDNGLGYSYLVISHAGGVDTVYGHVSGFLVQEGDRVNAGDPVALSGGRPGSPGAGLLTTGPHLHFAVRQDGALRDPLAYLRFRSDLRDFGSEE